MSRRHAGLRPLSDDHHRALVLARRLRRADGGTATLAHETARAFALELEPHFRVEERHLLPALGRSGETELVARTERDHARIRRLVADPWDASTAAALGDLLESHVRFEERELFPRAEAVLSEHELAAIAAAHAERGGGGAR